MEKFKDKVRIRLIKPFWAKPKLGKNQNPNFIEKIGSLDVMEGYLSDFSLEEILELNDIGYEIYWFPNRSDKPFKRGEFLNSADVNHYEWVFVDVDFKDGVYKSEEEFLDKLIDFPLKPHKLVRTGNGVHAYWRIKDLTRSKYLHIQKGLIKVLKTDDSIWNIGRLMRFPGTKNNKDYYKRKKVTCINNPHFLTSGDTFYKVSDFEFVCNKLERKDLNKIKECLDILNGKKVIDYEVSETGDLPEKFIKDLEKDKDLNTMFYDPTSLNGGDRSSTDWQLANVLRRMDYNRAEVYQIIYNTIKAREKLGNGRSSYAQHTVNKVFEQEDDVYFERDEKTEETKFVVQNVDEFLQNKDSSDYMGRRVNGPSFLDCLNFKWRTKQLLTLVAGAGSGKTSFSLKIFSDMIKNNRDSDGIFFYFNLEQLCGEVVERWQKLNGNDPDCMNRFYAVGVNTFEKMEKGSPPNLQSIYKIVKDTEKHTGKKAFAICHRQRGLHRFVR